MRWNYSTLLTKQNLVGKRFPGGEKPMVFGMLEFRQN